MNIRDAYHDERFDAGTDKITGYKTKTILAVPIFNPHGEVEGVIQAINKCIDQYGNQQYFDKNDTGLLEMISNLASSNLHNTIHYNQQTGIMNTLRMVLRTSVRLFAIKDDRYLCMRGCDILRDLFTCENASIYILSPEYLRVNHEDNVPKIYTYNSDGYKKEFDSVGILGDCVKKRQVIAINNSKSDNRYNGTIE